MVRETIQWLSHGDLHQLGPLFHWPHQLPVTPSTRCHTRGTYPLWTHLILKPSTVGV